MYNVTTKLEVNFRKGRSVATDMIGFSTLLMKYKIPVAVIDPMFIDQHLIERMRTGGQYKIITMVDFDSGKSYSLEKLRYLPKSIFVADGIEVLLSPNRTDKESMNELKVIYEFVRNLNPLMEIRWVFGFRTRTHQSMINFMQYLKNYPATFLRTDTNVEVPSLDFERHKQDIEFIRQHCGIPIKVSGNITLDMIKNLPEAARFDVSVTQAKKIINELKIVQEEPKEEVKQEVKQEEPKEEIKQEEIKQEEKPATKPKKNKVAAKVSP